MTRATTADREARLRRSLRRLGYHLVTRLLGILQSLAANQARPANQSWSLSLRSWSPLDGSSATLMPRTIDRTGEPSRRSASYTE